MRLSSGTETNIAIAINFIRLSAIVSGRHRVKSSHSRGTNSNFALEAAGINGNRILGVHLPWYGSLYWDAGLDRIQQTISPNIYVGEWIHWVFVKDASTGLQAVYRNGELFASLSGCYDSLSGIVTFVIGASTTGQYGFDGLFDDIRLYSACLSEEQVLMLYRRGNR